MTEISSFPEEMTEISSLPEEMLVHIFSFLPTSSLISVWRTSRQWRDLSRRPLAASIQSSWADSSYYPDSAELHSAAALVTSGHLPEDVMTNLATRIQSSLSYGDYWDYWPSVAEVRCAAALATTGHLTEVKYMQLRNLELPNREDMLSLARVVSCEVALDNVTGDIGPLLSNLTCTELVIFNMELDQAATSSLVRALQHGVKELRLWWGARVHVQTLLEYDGRGRCGEVECYGETWDTCMEEIKTWAARVNWGVKEGYRYIEMKRYYDDNGGDDKEMK